MGARLVARARELPVVGVLVRAAMGSQRELARDRSASIAYFGFVSLFPLLLGLVAGAGFLLGSADIEARLNDLIIGLFPVSADVVTRNIESVVRLREAAGLASVTVLMWSASKMVASLSRGINGALGLDRPYAGYLSPIRNFVLTVFVAALVLFGLALAPIADALAEMPLGDIGGPLHGAFDVIGSRAGGLAITAIMITVVYAFIPFKRPRWDDLWRGILVAALIIELGKEGFVAYVSNVASFDAVYGSMSSIIVLLIWFYFSARVLLYGAAVIAVRGEPRGAPGATRVEPQPD